MFITQTGEMSLHGRLVVLSKSLRPLPIVKKCRRNIYDQLTDPEIRYRQRYVDLVVNPGVKEIFRRNKVISTMRSSTTQDMEVETYPPTNPWCRCRHSSPTITTRHRCTSVLPTALPQTPHRGGFEEI